MAHGGCRRCGGRGWVQSSVSKKKIRCTGDYLAPVSASAVRGAFPPGSHAAHDPAHSEVFALFAAQKAAGQASAPPQQAARTTPLFDLRESLVVVEAHEAARQNGAPRDDASREEQIHAARKLQEYRALLGAESSTAVDHVLATRDMRIARYLVTGGMRDLVPHVRLEPPDNTLNARLQRERKRREKLCEMLAASPDEADRAIAATRSRDYSTLRKLRNDPSEQVRDLATRNIYGSLSAQVDRMGAWITNLATGSGALPRR
jgi:hypothetical protein